MGHDRWRVLDEDFRVVRSRPLEPGSAPPYRSFEGLYLPFLISVISP